MNAFNKEGAGMAINDTVQLSIIGSVRGQTHIHTLHFRYEDLTSTDQDLIDAWQAACQATYRAMFHTTDTPIQLLRAAQVCGTVPLRAPVEEAQAAGSQAGTSAKVGDSLPSWIAAVTSLRTQFAGKSRRGRFYIGGLFESDADLNNLSASGKTALQAYVTALMDTFKQGGTSTRYMLVVHSHKLASVPGTACQDSSTPITSALVRDPLGSMKSRKPGSGT